MREARYQSGNPQAAEVFYEMAAAGEEQGEEQGELFLLFAVRRLGLCALPAAAVQVVCPADGPVRGVPGCGAKGSRFLGLVSMQGQVELLFDLANEPFLAEAGAEESVREQSRVVAVAPDGRTLALRVSPPLRLVRWQGIPGDSNLPDSADAAMVCGCLDLPEDEGGKVWLLDSVKLFAQLEGEVRNG